MRSEQKCEIRNIKMEKTYKSKIGPELAIPLGIVIGVCIVLNLISQRWFVFFISAGVFGFITHAFLTTSYTIDGNMLIVKSGLMMNRKFGIDTITKIVESNTIQNGPASSFDRLELYYTKYDCVVISPKDKQGFIESMLDLNPNIDVIYKNKK